MTEAVTTRNAGIRTNKPVTLDDLRQRFNRRWVIYQVVAKDRRGSPTGVLHVADAATRHVIYRELSKHTKEEGLVLDYFAPANQAPLAAF